MQTLLQQSASATMLYGNPRPLVSFRKANLFQSCEKIRLSLENCEVEKDIVYFIKERGTGQEIPDPPRFINFCRGDVNDAGSEISEEDGYSVAQFQRTMNPAFRSSSPQPSSYESHHDPQSERVAQVGHAVPEAEKSAQQPPPLDLRRGGQLPPNYDPDQHGEISSIPHNAYPTDGMTMFCRTGPPSERSSATSAHRPSSRDCESEVSNPTSMSSVEMVSAKQSPVKSTSGSALPTSGDEKQVQKKRSAFFSNSPFRRKSRHEKERPTVSGTSSRGAYDTPTKQISPSKNSAGRPPMLDTSRVSGSPEPVDPRANFQLNVGNNVFDVASPDKSSKKAVQAGHNADDSLDPIARALADLKTGGKQSSTRVSADRYHGIQTPVSSAPSSAYGGGSNAPPPAYNDSSKRLDAPQPAFTSKQMQKTTQRYTGQTQNMLRGGASPRDSGTDIPRARSPAPRRSASPQVANRMGQNSPSGYQSNSMGSRYSQSPTPRRGQDPPYSPNDYNKKASPSHRPISPRPQFVQQARPSSAGGMELQLSGNHVEMYGGGGRDGYGSPRRDGRPVSYYGDGGAPVRRSRSRTLAVADSGRQLSRDGRPVLHFGKHMPILFTFD